MKNNENQSGLKEKDNLLTPITQGSMPSKEEIENFVLSFISEGENIKILNPFSNPEKGKIWEVYFETKNGPFNLKIVPDKKSEFGKELKFFRNLLARSLGGRPVTLFYTPFWFLAFIVIFSVLVGIFSGIFPARRAAKMDPLEALRYK